MDNEKFNKIIDLQQKIGSNFHGGYYGLSILFDKGIWILKRNNFKLNHQNFEDFYNGKEIEILGIEGKIFIENNGKIENRNFNDFFEDNYQFIFESNIFEVFNWPNNVLQTVINELIKISFDSDFSENEKATLIEGIVLKISYEIDKSEKCTKNENKILFAKLIYISNGYKDIYNKVHDLFGKYINVEKKIYNDIKTINYIDETWFKIGFDFANGNIFGLKEKGYCYSAIVKELYGDDKFKNYVSESFSPNPSNKSKCILKDHSKMNYIKNYFEKNSLYIHIKFIEYFDKLN